uniref:Uncharacterized protein n=1 Tax=Rhabditophanes sp. KR3021 TaxID=114890 RepID=A0AC35UEC3_9BILA
MSSKVNTLVLTVEAISSLLIGMTLYLAPHHVGDFLFQKTTDGVHWHLVRCVGGHITAGAYFAWRFRKSEKETQDTYFYMRLITCIFCLLLLFNARSVTPHLLEPRFQEHIISISMVLVFWYAGLLSKDLWDFGQTKYQSNYVSNILYQLDSIAAICIGGAWIAFPKWLLSRQVRVELVESHEIVARMMGVCFICSYIMSSRALHWAKIMDRISAIGCRAVCCFAILSGQLWSQHAYHVDWNDNHWIGISLFSTWTGIAFIYQLLAWYTYKSQDKTKTN